LTAVKVPDLISYANYWIGHEGGAVMPPSSSLTRVVSVMLGVRDLEASTRFYTETLGLKATLQSPQLALLDAGSITLGLSPGHARLSPQVNGATEVSFAVEDIRGAYTALAKEGITFLNEPRQVTEKEFAAHFRDPDGHMLSIFGPEA
jgi:catechol 2,3-dioxygenase-like lactoylglutathione lyase family enzyme